MKTRTILLLTVTVLSVIVFNFSGKAEQKESEKKVDILSGTIEGLKINNILTSQLELVEGTEVVVSHVEIPANTALPKHWHPGEEFIYVLEGSILIWQKDKSDTQLNKGDVFKVNLKQIHTGKTSEEGATILVFRVHETGKPLRINVE